MNQFDEKMKEYTSALTDGRIMSLELVTKMIKLHKVTEVYEVEQLIETLLDSAKDGRSE